MKRIALTLVLSSALVGLGSVAMAQNSTPVAPDNSAVNVRDRDPDAMTAGATIECQNRRGTHSPDSKGGGQGRFALDDGA